MRFVDEIFVEATAGKGGDGVASFAREMFTPTGGPNGGDGGWGGDVVLVGDNGFNTLSHLRFRRFLRAKNGTPGGKDKMHGKTGEDCTVKVPVGTLACARVDRVQRRARRAREYALCDADEPIAAFGGARPPWRGQETPTRNEVVSRCGVARVPKRREIDVYFDNFECQAQDCRLSVYDARAEFGRGTRAQRSELCRRRRAGAHRRS